MQGGNGMHTAPNPGPPIGKVHDISFDREKTLMRTIMTEGAGEEAREGSVVTVHVEIFQPDSEGQVQKIYRSKDEHPEGLRFNLFNDMHSGVRPLLQASLSLGRIERTWLSCCPCPLSFPRAHPPRARVCHAEALDRTLWHCKPGAVIDSICTCPDIAADPKLGIFAQRLSEGAQKLWCIPQSPVGIAQGALKDPPIMQPKPEDKEPPWAPPRYVTLFHVLLDSVTPGTIPMCAFCQSCGRVLGHHALVAARIRSGPWLTYRPSRATSCPPRRCHACRYMIAEERLEWVEQRKLWATELFKRGMHARALRHYKKVIAMHACVPCARSPPARAVLLLTDVPAPCRVVHGVTAGDARP
jgi:hypothetical protein